MLSLNSNLSFSDSSVMHSFVDSFFEGKKALVKERLMDSVRVIVDGLFEEMVGQVKEMLLPPKTAHDQEKPIGIGKTTYTPAKQPTSKSPKNISMPPKSKMIFATKSKPGPSTSAAAPQPFSGLYKRMAEEDGVSTSNSNCQAKKKKGVTEGDVALSTSDEVLVVIPIEQALMECGMDSSTFGVSSGGGDIEQQSKDTAHENIASSSKQQPKQRAEKKVACPEPNCGKHFLCNAELKRHLRTHTNAKPFGCNYSGCTLEFNQRTSAIRHILNMHLKKQKPNNAEEGGNEVADDPPDPSTYLTVKEELL